MLSQKCKKQVIDSIIIFIRVFKTAYKTTVCINKEVCIHRYGGRWLGKTRIKYMSRYAGWWG